MLESGNTTFDVEATIPTGLGMVGFNLGHQKIRSKDFTTDINIGVGYYEVFGIPTIGENAREPFKTLSQFMPYQSGIAPRVSFSLGYGF